MKTEPEKLLTNSPIIIMKHILTETHLVEMWYKWQPENFQTDIKNIYQKSLDWDIDFFDVLWPTIYSYKSSTYYKIIGNSIVVIDEPSKDDLEPLTKENFSERFNIDIQPYIENFKNKAHIENQLQLILYPENVEKYFLELLTDFPENDKERVTAALDICKKYHKWQMRDEWVEYYWHPIFVAIKGIEYNSTVDDIIVLLLHDTLEDTELSYEEVVNMFGRKVAKWVKWMSKNEYSNKQAYYETIWNDSELSFYKWLDRLANIYSLNFSSDEKRERYIKDTEDAILPMVQKYYPELAIEIENVLNYLLDGDVSTLPYEIQLRIKDLWQISKIKEWLEE